MRDSPRPVQVDHAACRGRATCYGGSRTQVRRFSSSRRSSNLPETAIAYGNLLLERLATDGSCLPALARLERFELRDRIDREGRLEHVVFPATAVVSMLVDDPHDGPIELAMVGRHGFVGSDVVLESWQLTPGEFAQVQIPGSAWLVDRGDFAEIVEAELATREFIATCARSYAAQIKRQVLCNALHSIDQRVRRWLLTTAEQAGSDRFPITQTFLSEMLGVRRASVNAVQRRLADEGAISYGAGRVEIVDRARLEVRSCRCHEVIVEIQTRPLAESAPL